MAKRRKRTSRDVPAKGRLRDMADRLWSKAILADWGFRCAVCGKTENKLDAHHLIRRQREKTRYCLRNGIALCFTHHRGKVGPNPHLDAAEWMAWLQGVYPDLHGWYVRTTEIESHRKFTGTTNAQYYIDQIQRLRQYVEPEDFERICGMRFSQYLHSVKAEGNDG